MSTVRQRSPSSKGKLFQEERQTAALLARRQGASFTEVVSYMRTLTRDGVPVEQGGELLYPKYSLGLAYRDVMQLLQRRREQTAEDVEAMRTMELERLDALQVSSWPKAIEGDPAAFDRVMRIMQHRAAIGGLIQKSGQQGEGDLAAFLEALRGAKERMQKLQEERSSAIPATAIVSDAPQFTPWQSGGNGNGHKPGGSGQTS